MSRGGDHRGRVTVLALVALAVVLLVAARTWQPASAATTSPSPASVVALNVGWTENPDSLNPFVGLTTSDYILYHLEYDYLVGFDAATLEPKPELATSWSNSADGKTWTFKTRRGVTWQDGVPFTARDVAFTFNYIVTNALPGVGAYTDGIVGATTIDDATVEVRTKAPKANMLDMIVPIIPEHIWSKVSPEAAARTYQNPPPVIGTGPFQITDYQSGKFVKLVANKHYWGGAPHIDELVFQTYQNPQNMVSDLRSGAIDGAVGVPTAQFASLAGATGITTNKGPSWMFIDLGFNCYTSPDSQGNPVLLDPKFRRALEYAVDRQKIVDESWQGYATVGSSIIVPYSAYHWQPPAEQSFSFDPAKARAMLDAAGYKDANGDGTRETRQGKPLTLRLYTTTDSPQNQTTARLILGWFRDVGVRAKLSVMDAGSLAGAVWNYKGAAPAPDFDMFVWYWTNDVDPGSMTQILTPAMIGVWSDTYWTDPEYTKLNLEQSRTIDEASRKPIVERLQQIAYDASPYAVLAYPYQLEAYRTDRWSGWVHTPTNVAGESGSVLFSWNNIDTYTHVARATVATAGGSHTGSYIAATVVVAALAVLAVILLRRRGRHGAREE
jgi:peptide/nickel transport system substrate-binding protein